MNKCYCISLLEHLVVYNLLLHVGVQQGEVIHVILFIVMTLFIAVNNFHIAFALKLGPQIHIHFLTKLFHN